MACDSPKDGDYQMDENSHRDGGCSLILTILAMVTILGKLTVNILVMVSLIVYGILLIFIYKIRGRLTDTQTDRQTDTTVCRVALQLKTP